uniref:Uncharacterized protein n=1 Tax=Octopus bimaculoides TaxID=37653 RepID=A0A0L8G9T9_OCTBM
MSLSLLIPARPPKHHNRHCHHHLNSYNYRYNHHLNNNSGQPHHQQRLSPHHNCYY